MSREITYLDTFGDGGYTYQDFEDYCKEQNWDMQEDELEIPAEYSASYREWVEQNIEDDIECFFENLKYSDVNGACCVSGFLGLWDGRHEIVSKKFETLTDAVEACWGECDYVQVWLQDGTVYVKAYHHDGTNYFEIRPVNGEYPEYLY